MSAMTPERLYKFLTADLCSPQGSGRWTPGRWRSVSGTLVPCEHAIHACRAQDLVHWLSGPELWTFEFDEQGYDVHEDSKVYGRRGRILTRVEAWNDRTARLFAADWAEHVLPLFEAAHPDDDRPRRAIAVARRFADGAASAEELDAAGAAAWAASTAVIAARGSWAPARAAAAAAWPTAWDTAWAARDAERKWQTQHLLELLGIEP